MLNLMKLESRIVLDGAGIVDAIDHASDTNEIHAADHQTIPDYQGISSNPSAGAAALLSADTDHPAESIDVVLISDALPDQQDLADAVDPDAKVIVFDADTESASDILNEVVETAEQENVSIGSLTILSHGGEGYFNLGTDVVTSGNVSDGTVSWDALDPVMQDDGAIYVYGCSVSDGSGTSQELLDDLADATGTHVFASDDATGNGGDWDLEAASSNADFSEISTPVHTEKLDDYSGTLAPPVFPGPPAINLPLSFSVNEDYTTGVYFTVFDDVTPTQDLLVWGTSDNQQVLPDSGINCQYISGDLWRVEVFPAANESGSVTITIHARDDQDEVSTDSVILEVRPINDKPSFEPIDQVVDGSGGPVTIPLDQWVTDIDLGPLENSGEPYAQTIQAFDFTYVGGDADVLTETPQVDLPSGNLLLSPNAAYGQNGTVTYMVTLTDSGGVQFDTPGTGEQIGFNQAEQVLVTLTINFNQAPEAQDQNIDGCEGVAVEGNLTAFDPEGDDFRYVLDSPIVGDYGEITYFDETTGAFSYETFDDNFFGSADTIAFHVEETSTMNPQASNSAYVNISVNPVNDAPVFDKGVNINVDEDSGFHRFEGWATDIRPADIDPGPYDESDQNLHFEITTNNDALFTSGPFIDPNTGDLTFTVAPDAAGRAIVTVVLMDDGGTGVCGAEIGEDTSEVQTFSIDIGDINDQPTFDGGQPMIVCEDDPAQVVYGWATNISAGPGDEAAQQLDFIVQTDRPELFSVLPDIDPATGNLTYTPAPDAFGTANLTIVLRDDGGTDHGGVDTSLPVHTTITIEPGNDAPGFTSGPNQVIVTGSGEQSISGWATDITPAEGVQPGPFDESDQNLTFVVQTDNDDLFAAGPEIDPITGDLIYTPAEGMTGVANIIVTLYDDGGTANCNSINHSGPQSFTIEVEEPPGPGPGPETPPHVVEGREVIPPPGPGPVPIPEMAPPGGELEAGIPFPGDVGEMGSTFFPPVARGLARGPAADAPLFDGCSLEEALHAHLGCRYAPGIDPESRFSLVRWETLGTGRPVLDEEHDLFSRLFMREPGDQGFNIELEELSHLGEQHEPPIVFSHQPGEQTFNDIGPGELKEAFFSGKDKNWDRTMRWCQDPTTKEVIPWENCRSY